MIIEAKEPFNLLTMRGDPQHWSVDNLRRLKIVAWLIRDDGVILPITVCPLMHSGPQYIIEDATTGLITGFDMSTKAVWIADNAAAWVALIKDMVLSASQTAGNA